MTTVIKLKNSTTTSTTPSSLAQGEVAINITDKKAWVGNASTTPILFVEPGVSLSSANSWTNTNTFKAIQETAAAIEIGRAHV